MGTEEYSTTSDQQGELDRSRLLLAMTHVLNLEELHTACFDLVHVCGNRFLVFGVQFAKYPVQTNSSGYKNR